MALTITIPGAVEATIGATAPAILTVGVGVPGATGATGAQGPQGDPGEGVPVGGTAGQVLAKIDGTNYNTEWSSLPWFLTKAGNLSDLADVGTANTNLGLGEGNEVTFLALNTINGDLRNYLDGNGLQVVNLNTENFVWIKSDGIQFADLTVQTTAYTGGGDYLPLAGGAMDANASITASDTSTATDLELAGWGLGVQLSADHTKGTTVEFDGLDTYDGASHMQVTPTGITFPDSSVQVTAWTGNLGDYRTLIDYDFTNVADTKLTTYGLTVLPNAPEDPNNFDSFVNATEVRQSFDTSEGGTIDGVQIYTSYKYDGLTIMRQDWSSEGASLMYGSILNGYGLKFINFDGSTASGSIQYLKSQVTFGNGSVQTIAFPGFAGYAPLASPAFTGNPTAPTPATSDNDTSIATTAYVKAQTFGDRYLTTSTTSNTIGNGNKTFTIGTGLSYTPTQNLTISYDAGNHMHGEVLTYNSGTGVLTVDIKNHTGSGTYASWVVNVGGVTPATSVAWGDITGTLSTQTDLQNALDLKANLASPTFTGTPSLPTGTIATTQSPGNNTTALATTEFVTAATPSASTTVSGLVELATNAEAQNGSSTTLGMTPSTVAYAKSSPSYFRMSALSSAGATSGTGSTASLLVGGFNTRSPTTAIGYGILSFGLYFHSRASGGQVATPLPWNKRFVAQFRFAPRTLGTDANTINRVLFGKASGSTTGELTLRGVGVRQIANGALELVVHNGTTFTAVTSSFTPTVAQSSTDLRIVSDGAGNVTLFNNDTQIATTSAGPSTAGASNNYFLTVESENIGVITGTNNTLYVAEISFEFAY